MTVAFSGSVGRGVSQQQAAPRRSPTQAAVSVPSVNNRAWSSCGPQLRSSAKRAPLHAGGGEGRVAAQEASTQQHPQSHPSRPARSH